MGLYVLRNFMTTPDREGWWNGQGQIRNQPVSQPASAYDANGSNAFRILCNFRELRNQLRFNAIEHPRKDRMSRLPHHFADDERDDGTDDSVGDGIAELDAQGAEEHSETGEAVDSRMLSIRNESSTFNLLSGPDADHRRAFIAEEPDHGGEHDRIEIRDDDGVEEAVDRLVTGGGGAEEDHQHYGNTCQILDAPQTVGEAVTRPSLRQSEGDPKGGWQSLRPRSYEWCRRVTRRCSSGSTRRPG